MQGCSFKTTYMARQIDVEKAKAQFARLVGAAAKGEEIILTKEGQPMAKIEAIPAEPEKKASEKKAREKRRLGQLKGKVWLAPDFDAPDAEIEGLSHGGGLNDPPTPFKHE